MQGFGNMADTLWSGEIEQHPRKLCFKMLDELNWREAVCCVML